MSGTLVLDSQALSLFLRGDARTAERVKAAHNKGVRVVVSAITTVEAEPTGVHPARMDWVLSRLIVLDVTRDIARSAQRVLRDAGITGGHIHALDAVVVATALSVTGPVAVATSDPDDITKLAGGRVGVIHV
ncbi:DNA-binding protein [Nocardiopsis sp. EMB25]|uniref:type II toxin-antitoxin system VapC family toxin n=1 Tax=Nocardiopsis sp. EMB25 TaxID=2835867 RepID=UPI0022833252|nr:DNA-binding protein [Nocardiopsis sp. EMB25]MCY9785528.1 DNA-binding protein [Nocardiopsis sp. EMB25]